MPDTIALYRDSTIVVAFVTYVVSVLLIYLTDQLGLIRKAWALVATGISAMIPRKRHPFERSSEKATKPEPPTV